MTKPATPLQTFVAQQIKRRREAAKITQAALAVRAAVTVETIARLERVLRGKASANANPSLDTLERIASSLGCHAADLLDGRAQKGKADPIVAMLRSCRPETRRRIGAVAEALIRDERKAG